MRTFEFSGIGNYSQSFGWDNGISCSIDKDVAFNTAKDIDEHNCSSDSFAVYGGVLPSKPIEGIYISFFNDNAGTRNVRGWIIAEDIEKAEEMLTNYEASYEVVEYEAE